MVYSIAIWNLSWLYLVLYGVFGIQQIASFTLSVTQTSHLHHDTRQQHMYSQFLLFSITPTSSDVDVPLPQLKPLSLDRKLPVHTNIQKGGGAIQNEHTTPIYNKIDPTSVQQQVRYVADVFGLGILSLLFSIGLISWEDMTCKYVLPNRHRTSISLYQKSSTWGMSTIHGMGFSSEERRTLINAASEAQNFEMDPFLNVPSYNEVMLIHRTVTVPHWKLIPTSPMISNAIHTIIESLQQLDILRDMANDYQWDSIRHQLYAEPISDLSIQSSILRQVSSEMNEVVGFDWGSCAWRHCGAISDIQEAIDEMDQLLGVLEPREIIFCIDIVERSLRDILSVVPWNEYASESDIAFYNNLPPYVTLVNRIEDVDDDTALSRIDLEYFKALQELRIE